MRPDNSLPITHELLDLRVIQSLRGEIGVALTDRIQNGDTVNVSRLSRLDLALGVLEQAILPIGTSGPAMGSSYRRAGRHQGEPAPEPEIRIRTEAGDVRALQLTPGSEWRPPHEPSEHLKNEVLFYVAGNQKWITGPRLQAEESIAEFIRAHKKPPLWCLAVDRYDPDERLVDGVVVDRAVIDDVAGAAATPPARPPGNRGRAKAARRRRLSE